VVDCPCFPEFCLPQLVTRDPIQPSSERTSGPVRRADWTALVPRDGRRTECSARRPQLKSLVVHDGATSPLGVESTVFSGGSVYRVGRSARGLSSGQISGCGNPGSHRRTHLRQPTAQRRAGDFASAFRVAGLRTASAYRSVGAAEGVAIWATHRLAAGRAGSSSPKSPMGSADQWCCRERVNPPNPTDGRSPADRFVLDCQEGHLPTGGVSASVADGQPTGRAGLATPRCAGTAHRVVSGSPQGALRVRGRYRAMSQATRRCPRRVSSGREGGSFSACDGQYRVAAPPRCAGSNRHAAGPVNWIIMKGGVPRHDRTTAALRS
jgi:hypothetical protein